MTGLSLTCISCPYVFPNAAALLTWISLGLLVSGYIPAPQSERMAMSDPAGLAALSICESMLLALTEAGILDNNEVKGILEDAAAAHRNAVGKADGAAAEHLDAAVLIERMLAGRDPVRPGLPSTPEPIGPT